MHFSQFFTQHKQSVRVFYVSFFITFISNKVISQEILFKFKRENLFSLRNKFNVHELNCIFVTNLRFETKKHLQMQTFQIYLKVVEV